MMLGKIPRMLNPVDVPGILSLIRTSLLAPAKSDPADCSAGGVASVSLGGLSRRVSAFLPELANSASAVDFERKIRIAVR